jgi:hypothetical protein
LSTSPANLYTIGRSISFATEALFIMMEFRTTGYNGYAVKYSPFYDSRIAVGASMNYGLVGSGRLFILGLTPQGIVAERRLVYRC